jgi:hypothetical protein
VRYSRAGGVFMVMVLLTGCDSNRVPVEATVISMTHKCRLEINRDDPIAERARQGDESAAQEMFGDCSTDGDFLKARQDFDSIDRRYSGSATARVSFISPVDNTSVEGELVFDGEDREFYTVRPNTQVMLRVDQTDHSRIRFGGMS